MKQLFFLTCLFLSVYAQGQRIKSFRASNGIVYHENDTLRLGRGSMPNGDFKYVQIGGWGAIVSYSSNSGSDQFNLPKNNSGLNMIIKKIKEYDLRGGKKIIFTVAGGNITNYVCYIEDAIATCEIRPCKEDIQAAIKTSGTDPADELKKYFDLKERGAITQSEYDSIKNKLLHP